MSKVGNVQKGQATSGAGDGGKGRRSTFLVIVSVSVGMMIAALPTFLILAPALLPTFILSLLDVEKDSNKARTVGLMTLCGAAPYLNNLWQNGHTIEAATQILSDMLTWCVIYGASVVSLIMLWAGPQLAASLLDVKVRRYKAKLEATQQSLVAEWGEEVKK